MKKTKKAIILDLDETLEHGIYQIDMMQEIK